MPGPLPGVRTVSARQPARRRFGNGVNAGHNNKPLIGDITMRALVKWTLRLASLLAGLVLGLAVLAGGALFVLDDEDYRSALIWAAGRFLDASLEIRGPFALHLGREATLSAVDTSLRAHDGSYSLEAGSFQTRVRLDSLLEGIVWVKGVMLADVRVEAKQSGDAREFDWHGASIPTFVVEEVRLNNINVVYRQAAPERTHTFDLMTLVVDDINNSGPLGIQGNGRIEDRSFSIQGQLDSLAQLVGAAQPYSVQLDLTSDSLITHVEGVIDRPLAGEGLDLQLSITDSRLSRTLRLWDARAPELGSMSARMQLRGDYDAPRLEQINAQLKRPGELDLNVSGQVGDLTGPGQVELHIDGHSSNPYVTSWLLFDRDNKLKTLSVKCMIRGANGRFRLDDLRAQARTRSGVQIDLGGSTDILASLNGESSRLSGLKLVIDAPSTRALTALTGQGGEAIPEFGRVKVAARLIPSLESIGLDGVQLDIGGPGRVRATATGSGGIIPFTGMAGWTGYNLTLDAQADKSIYLNKYLERTLPELGAVRARMRVRGGLSGVSVESLQLSVGDKDKPALRANGSVRTGFSKRSTSLDIGFDVATADLIAAVSAQPPSTSPGRLEGSITASDLDGSWGVDKFAVVSVQTSLFQLKASGTLGDLANRDQGEVRTMLEIDDPPALGRALGVDLSGLSRYRGQGSLRIVKGRLNYTASNTLGATTSKTVLTGTLTGDKPRLKGELDIPVLHLADFGLHTPPAVAVAADKQAKGGGGKSLFSRRPLDFGILRSFDLDLKVSVPEVTGSTLRLKHLNAGIALQGGVLRVSPVKLEFEGGPAAADLMIDARKKPRITLSITGDDLSLGPALAEIQDEVPVEGYVNMNADVRATGSSAHELASSLEGKLGFGLENARVPRKYVEFLAIDVFGWAINTAMRREPYANLDCVMVSFDIKEGIATSTLLAADGPSLAVAGTATLDLGDETIDMTLLPKQKQTLFSQLSPVHVKGPLRDPEVTALPVKAAITSLGSMALVPALPMVAIPAILGEKLWATLKDHDRKEGGCARLTEKIVKRKEKEKFW